jgi:hypothetical protein
MKKFNLTSFILLIAVLLCNPTANAQTPFACSIYGYLTKGATNQQSDFYQVDVATNQETLIVSNINAAINATNTGTAPLGWIGINGIGYNQVDNFIYGGMLSGGTNPDANQLVRIDATGTVTVINVAGFPTDVYSSDISTSGIMYMRAGSPNLDNQLYRLDLNTLTMLSPITLTNAASNSPALNFTTTNIADIGMNPLDGNLYGITANSPAEIIQIDPNTGVVTVLSYIGTTLPVGGYGACYFDNLGKMYVQNNTTGDLFRVLNISTAPQVSFLQSGTAVGFNDGARCSANTSLLPINITAFTGSTINCDAQLTWDVNNAVNFNHFEIEQSVNGRDFKTVATVVYTAGVNSYSIEATLKPVETYFRLKLVDIDNHFEYSQILTMKGCNASNGIVVIPNPAQDAIKFVGANGKQDIVMMDATGRIVLKQNNVTAQTSLEVQHLAKGIYNIVVTDKFSKESTTLQFVKY